MAAQCVAASSGESLTLVLVKQLIEIRVVVKITQDWVRDRWQQRQLLGAAAPANDDAGVGVQNVRGCLRGCLMSGRMAGTFHGSGTGEMQTS